jgi:CheY-like chemotaxis protein
LRIEVRCPACQRGLLIEERSVGAGLQCPGCAATVVAPRAAAPEPAKVAIGEAVLPTSARPPVALPERPIGAPAGNVVCPRCKLHFVPRRRTEKIVAPPRHSVLVVEDMEYFRQVASHALSAKYEVQTARTVKEGLSILSQRSIDLVVLDLTLEGREEGRQLLAYASNKGCPVLIYTAKDESEIYGESWEELKRLGARDIVIKGMNVGESLARKADELLGLTELDETL